MRKLLLLLFFLPMICWAQNVNYKECKKQINSEITLKKKEINSVKKQIKNAKNDVPLHKLLVVKTTELDALVLRKNKIIKAEKLYKQLAKENEKFDKWKVQLLNLKEASRQADEEITQ